MSFRFVWWGLAIGMIVLALVGMLAHAAPDPGLTARWVRPGVATVTWTQQQHGCLWRNQTFVGCYSGAGRMSVAFGAVGPMDAAYMPAAGDVYTLVEAGQAWEAPLRGVVYLGVLRA